MQPIIEVKNISKKYQLGYYKPYDTLRDMVVGWFNKNKIKKSDKKDFWALKDVSFEVQPGEVVGIIGRNGAGKSTLLKILSRITLPTTGEAVIRGRVASLLEVGTGFSGELSGRENIYLNGAVLGMSRKEINQKLDEIIDFAEVRKFIDTPVKYYSSGMYARLAFAVAAHLDPEILIVDEVLSVGDARFQKKSLGKMENMTKSQGKTVLFVSHNLGSIKQLCTRTILLDDGRINFIGNTEEAIKEYTKTEGENKFSKIFEGNLIEDFKLTKILVNNQSKFPVNVLPSEDIVIELSVKVSNRVLSFIAELSIYIDGIRLLTLNDIKEGENLKKGNVKFLYKIPRYLLRPGNYSVGFGGHQSLGDGWLWGNDLAVIVIPEVWDNSNIQTNIGTINVSTNGIRIYK